MEIFDMFKEQNELWRKENIELFGVNLLDVDNLSFNDLQASIDDSVSKYWNVEEEKQCKLAKLILSNKLSRDSELMTPNSFKLELNPSNMCIDVEAEYTIGEGKKAIKKIAAIPTPGEGLVWIINGTKYVPRVTASRDREMVMKLNTDPNIVVGHFWRYDIKKKEFTCLLRKNPFVVTPQYLMETLSVRSKALLTATIGEELNENNVIEAIEKLPVFKSNSLFNYAFYHLEYFENLLTNPDSKKFANPLKNIILGINMLFLKQADDNVTMAGQLIISKSPIFALENFRTTVNKYVSKNSYIPSFTYCDTIGFFDAFKTTTSRSAGRQRLLVDQAIVKDGMIWIKEKDGYHNMYEYVGKPSKYRLSCISHSLFCNNNKAKRIMMTAKLTAQAVAVDGEKDPFTHRIPARVVFADIEGYTYADAILISESFAKRLNCHDKVQLITENNPEYLEIVDKYLTEPDHELTFEELKVLFPAVSEVILKNYKNATISKIDKMSNKKTRLFVEYDIPFGLGDKISNLHGAKGVVGKIIPDDEMPRLMNKVGNMEPGPMEVVISAFSTIRRGSLGQIFEAWAGATGHKFENNDDFINQAVDKYADEMKEFSNKSVLEYKGEKITKPIGIIDIIRLYHHASTHASKSWIKSNYNKMLKFGEMEKLNLMANECTDILKELSIRSTHKHAGAYKMIMDMERNRELPKEPKLSLKFARMLKSIGYDIYIGGQPLVETDNSNAVVAEEGLEKVDPKDKKKKKLSVDESIMNDILSEDKIDLYSLDQKLNKEVEE